MFSLFSRPPVVPVLRFTGPIGMATPLRPGLSLASAAGAIEKAFRASKLPSVAVLINSPGGSPVQSHLIYRRIRQLAAEHGKRVYVFCEDVAASGGYFLAIAGDEIYADPSSIVGSIGVVSAGFGFDRAIEKLGIDRRVYTAGNAKAILDPFKPEKREDIVRLRALQNDIHETFIGLVKERRGSRLSGAEEELFSGAFWTGAKALEFGLVDGVADVRTRMRELHGDKVRLRVIPMTGGGLLARFRRLPGFSTGGSAEEAPSTWGAGLPAEVLSALEARALWSRFGL